MSFMSTNSNCITIELDVVRGVREDIRTPGPYTLPLRAKENELRYPPNIFDLVVIRETFMYNACKWKRMEVDGVFHAWPCMTPYI